MFAGWSNLIRLLFPFKYPLKLDSLIWGGIHTNQCIWSGQASNSIISTPFHWHSFLFICPMSCLIFPYFTCLRYLGATTLWFMQFLVVWYTPCVDFQIVLLCLFARGWLDLLAWYHRSFFCSSAEASLNPPALLVVFVNQEKKTADTSLSAVFKRYRYSYGSSFSPLPSRASKWIKR